MASKISQEIWLSITPESTFAWETWPPKSHKSKGLRKTGPLESRENRSLHNKHGCVNFMRAEGHTRAGAARVTEEKTLPWQMPWCLSCPAVVFVRTGFFTISTLGALRPGDNIGCPSEPPLPVYLPRRHEREPKVRRRFLYANSAVRGRGVGH